MEKLKKPKMQHDHTWTDILKVGIFAILMIAPLLAVGSKCLYVACNKNAKESYYGETINQEIYNDVSYTNLEANKTYYFSNELLTQTYTQTQQSQIYYSNINWVAPLISFDLNNANNFRFYVNSEGTPRVYFYNDNTSIGRPFDLNTETLNFSFTYVSSSNLSLNDALLSNVNFEFKTYNKFSYLDNAFYYAIDELGQEQVFSWTKQTALYSGINEMTQGLGIDPTNNILAILLTYWMLLTIVYVIVDIVIVLFVKITHFITA